MIVIDLPNTEPMDRQILSEKLVTSSFTVPLTEREQADCCSCSFVCGCDYVEFAFAGDDEYTSDRTQRFFQKKLSSDTVAIELWKGSEKVADIINNTLGTYYNNVGVDQLYDGCEIEWAKVYNAHGGGRYFLKFIATIAGISITRETHKFLVMPFDKCAASETVRIESVINSNIEGRFNYVGMNQRLWARVKGTFDGKQPKVEDSEYQDGGRRFVDFQTMTPTVFDLQMKNLPSPLFNMIVYDMMVAEDVRISDYRIPFFESYVSYPVKRVEYEDVGYTDEGTKANVLIRMKPRENKPLGRII